MQGKEAGVGLCEVPLSPLTLGLYPCSSHEDRPMCVGDSLWILNSEHLTCRRDSMCPCGPPWRPQVPENTCVSRFLWAACSLSQSWICPLSRGLNSLSYCLYVVGDSGLGAGGRCLRPPPSHQPGTPALSCFLGDGQRDTAERLGADGAQGQYECPR